MRELAIFIFFEILLAIVIGIGFDVFGATGAVITFIEMTLFNTVLCILLSPLE